MGAITIFRHRLMTMSPSVTKYALGSDPKDGHCRSRDIRK
jgi:hypothetical protein